MTEFVVKLPDLDEFAAALGTTFRASVEGGPDFDLVLAEATRLLLNDVQDCFSLIFRAPPETESVQRLYRLEHPALGTMHLLLVPVKKDETGLYFEAIFNRLIKK
jgi:hypothetical protein